MSAPDHQSASEQPTFEAALAELEAIVAELEEGQAPLAQSLARYEAGVKLLKQCYDLLETAERRIEMLKDVDPDGRAHSEPFDDAAISLEEKAQTRGRRRSSNASPRQQSAPNKIDESEQLF